MRKITVGLTSLRATWTRVVPNTSYYRSATLSNKMTLFERQVAFTPALRLRRCLLLLAEY